MQNTDLRQTEGHMTTANTRARVASRGQKWAPIKTCKFVHKGSARRNYKSMFLYARDMEQQNAYDPICTDGTNRTHGPSKRPHHKKTFCDIQSRRHDGISLQTYTTKRMLYNMSRSQLAESCPQHAKLNQTPRATVATNHLPAALSRKHLWNIQKW